jgi:hypothetical protein
MSHTLSDILFFRRITDPIGRIAVVVFGEYVFVHVHLLICATTEGQYRAALCCRQDRTAVVNLPNDTDRFFGLTGMPAGISLGVVGTGLMTGGYLLYCWQSRISRNT